VRVERDDSSLKLTVRDDGRGFDPTARFEGQGLASIARRMRDLGGTARWDSRPGQGATFTALVPMRRPRREARPPHRSLVD